MANLNNEERKIKIESASFSLKNYLEYFKIDCDFNELCKILATGNNFIDLENIIEYTNGLNINLIKKTFTKESFLNFKKCDFPIIATVKKNNTVSYIYIQKKIKNNIVIFENNTKKIIDINDFFNISTYEYISNSSNNYLDIKLFLNELNELKSDKLFKTLIINILIFIFISIFELSFINLVFENINSPINILPYIVGIFVLTGVQISIFSNCKGLINSIAFLHIDVQNKTFILNSLTFGLLSIMFLIIIGFIDIYVFIILLFVSLCLFYFSLYFSHNHNIYKRKLNINKLNYENTLNDVKNIVQHKKHIGNLIDGKKNNYFESYIKYENHNNMFRVNTEIVLIFTMALCLIVDYKYINNSSFVTYALIFICFIPYVLAFNSFTYTIFNKNYENNTNIENDIKPNVLATFNESLIIKNLHYYYTHNKYVLKNINIIIPYGKKVLIYGDSGSGKTTLSNLISLNTQTQTGNILFDNISHSESNTDNITNNMFYVSEDVQMFNASILDNITMFERISMKRIVNVCKKLGIHSNIQNMPFNYKTIINKDNLILSDVLIKKIAIARAILNQPDFLIIDGITDVFDENDINRINNLIDENKKIQTTLIFARNIPVNMKYDISYKIDNGIIGKKNKYDSEAIYEKR